MSTEVQHGPHPKFSSRLTGGTFSVTVTGYYTDVAVDPRRIRTRRSFFSELWRWLSSWWTEVEPDTQGIGAGGVTAIAWASDRDAKRVNELLVLRTCFRSWYEQQMRVFGHKAEGAYRL